MNIAILGYGSQGKAALAYWQALDPANQVTVCDQNDSVELPAGTEGRLGADYLQGLGSFDLIVRSPSTHPRDIVAANPDAPNILSKVTTVTNEFFRVSPTKNIIGVTGTKGKGTSSSLIVEILKAAGKTAYLGGNFGTPPLELLEHGLQPDDWVILELANFQLIDITYSPAIGVCVMVAPEHLDWHTDMEEYVTAKSRMFVHQTAEDMAVFNRLNGPSRKVAEASPGQKISYEVPVLGADPTETTGAYVKDGTIFMNETPVCATTDVALAGYHNLQNVCAAIAATWEIIEGDAKAITQAVQNFAGLPYRLELIREVDGVKYYDDSLGTTPETAIAAIEAFSQPKVMILGGSDKGVSFEPLAKAVLRGGVQSVVLIDSPTAPKIRGALEAAGFDDIVNGGTTMPEIVAAARQQAKPGDVVLLSTACASFGLFNNYQDRGDQFNAAVRALA